MKTQHKKPATGAKKETRTLAYPVEFRLRIVKLFLEEGYSTGLLCEQLGISFHLIHRWVKAYRLKASEGLEPKRPVTRKAALPVKFGDRRWRSGQIIRSKERGGSLMFSSVFFLMRTSSFSVHQPLTERGLVKKAQRRPEKNPPKPRFFKRVQPNQLWQSHIMTFRLEGHNAIQYCASSQRYPIRNSR